MLRYPAPAQSAASEQGARPQHLLDVSFALCVPLGAEGRAKGFWGEQSPRAAVRHTCSESTYTTCRNPLCRKHSTTAMPQRLVITLRVTSTSNTHFGSLAGLGLGLFPTSQQPPKWDAPNPAINSWRTPSRGSSLSRTSWCARVALGSVSKPNLPAGTPKGDPMGHLRDCLGVH